MKYKFSSFYLAISIIITTLIGCESVHTEGLKQSIKQPQSDRTMENYILGADVSSLPELEDYGVKFIDVDGKEKSLLSLLKDHGFNYIRLRTFVEPNNPYGYASSDSCQGKIESYNDKEHVIKFAKRIKAHGFKLLLDFHYSDTWADPNKQVIPQSWRGISTIDAMSEQVHAYTEDVLTELKLAGVEPDMVQVGNEITPGMLIHVPTEKTDCYGNHSTINSELNGSVSNIENLGKLLQAGISAVEQVLPESPIMLHLENTEHPAGIRSWINNIYAQGVSFDVLGLSAYEQWQGPSSEWQATLTGLAATYPELSFSIVEYNPQRTLVNEIMLNLPNQQGLGTFFWEPALSGEWGQSMFNVEGLTYKAKQSAFEEYDKLIKDNGLAQ